MRERNTLLVKNLSVKNVTKYFKYLVNLNQRKFLTDKFNDRQELFGRRIFLADEFYLQNAFSPIRT